MKQNKILIVTKDDKTTEISMGDEVTWQGYIEDSDTIEDILNSLGFEVERIDHSFNGENLDIIDDNDQAYNPEYSDSDDEDDLGCVGATL